MVDPLDPSTLQVDESAARLLSLQLIVLDDNGSRAYPLPASGQLVIGRAVEAEVHIDDPSISRRHAVLHVGKTVQIEDLGSANGTRVHGRSLAPGERADVQPGDLLEIGKTVCVLRGPLAVERPRRLSSHAYFEARVEDECARASRRGERFAVVRVHVERAAPELEAALTASLRPGDAAAAYGEGEYEILLLDRSPEEAETVTRGLVKRLGGLADDLRTGLACYPRDGTAPEHLIARACAAVRPTAGRAEAAEAADLVIADGTMRELHRLLERIARGTINVLLLGETGVGKEVFAERIHALSARADGPLLRLNCAAFTESLLESELFGHEKGAFTGAHAHKAGLLETANGGTVFLDEVGELPLVLQAKLLRVLEERQVRRVGGLKPTPIDVRFIAATNRDLDADFAAGRFRADLFFRLNGFSVVIPPLRERTSGIEPLARRFAAEAARQADLDPAPEITAETLSVLRAHRWPGNIRELRNVIERAVLLSAGQPIELAHLPMERMTARPPAEAVPAAAPSPPLDEAQRIERNRVVEALAQAAGNQGRAAEILGVSRQTLIARMTKYGLPRPRKRD